MSRRAVFTEKAPKPLPGIYTQAIVAGGFVYCSSQIPLDPATDQLVKGGIKEHTHQCIRNLEQVLIVAGSQLENCVKVNVLLNSMNDFDEMNEVYMKYFGDIKPARTRAANVLSCMLADENSCVAVKSLPLDTDVEIKCVAIM